jgi:hypothetical protein
MESQIEKIHVPLKLWFWQPLPYQTMVLTIQNTSETHLVLLQNLTWRQVAHRIHKSTIPDPRNQNSDPQWRKREPHRVQKGSKISLNSIHGSHRQQIAVQVSHHGVQWSQNHAHRSQKDANMVPTWGQHDAKTHELGAHTVSKLITSQPNTSWPNTSQLNTSLSKQGPAAGA